MSGADDGGGAGCEAWLAASDGLVAGVHHALNNRVATMSALVQLASLDPEPGPDALRALREELERLAGTLRLVGMLPRRPGEGPIPLQLPDLLPDVLALARQHRELRDVEVAVELPPGLPPVLAPETALAHALLALLVGAGAAARGRGAARAEVRVSADDRWVSLEAEPADPAGLAALFAAAGGGAEAAGARMVARLPTLAEGRRSPAP